MISLHPNSQTCIYLTGRQVPSSSWVLISANLTTTSSKKHTFVVTVEASGIKYEWLVCQKISQRVSIPQVSMNEARLDLAASGLEWSKKSRNDLLVQGLYELLKLFTGPL